MRKDLGRGALVDAAEHIEVPGLAVTLALSLYAVDAGVVGRFGYGARYP